MKKIKEISLTETTVKHRGKFYVRTQDNNAKSISWKEKGRKRFVKKKTSRKLEFEYTDGLLAKKIVDLVKDRRKTEAVRLYKDTHGTTLAVARIAVNKILAPKSTSKDGIKEANESIAAFVKKGSLLAAVKLYKDTHGTTLKKAKEIVDGMKAELKK